MKSILLTTTALVAFAGAAAAQGIESGITFTGEATLGFNTDDDLNDDIVDGSETDNFFWDASIDVTMTSVLDNGLVATATFGLNVTEDDLGEDVTSSDYVITLAGENASLTFGDVDPVAEDRFNDVDGGTTRGFADQDAHLVDAGFSAILVGEATYAGWTGAISLGVADDEDALIAGVDEVDALQLHVAGTVSIVDLEFAYQDGIAGADDVYGIAASTTFSNATLTISYVDDEDENSTGLSVAYPFGPVTVEAYYSINDIAEDNWGLEADYSANGISVNAFLDVTGEGAAADDDDLYEFGLEGSYDMGNGLELFAGYISDDGGAENDLFYLAGEYDLGGGAELIVSYADDGDDSANLTDDEVGDPEYLEGTTVEVSFEF